MRLPAHFSNHNVRLTLALVGVSGCADSVWAGTALVAYLYIISNGSNSKVGFVEASQGLASVLTALPIGWVADHYGRSKACRIGSVSLFIAIGMTLYAVVRDVQAGIGDDVDHQQESKLGYLFMLLAMCMMGLGGGVVSGPVQALYADSIPTGQRSQYYVYLFGVYLLASCVGPAVTIAIFQSGSNSWTLDELRDVIYVGMGLEFFAACILLFFRDDCALGEEADHLEALNQGEEGSADQKAGVDLDKGGLEEAGDAQEPQTPPISASSMLCSRQQRIPMLTFVASLITALGAGMTVKFFPLFFKNECDLSPSAVQGIYVAVPIAIILFSGFAQRLASTGFGRVQCIMISKAIGVSCLVLMVLCLRKFDAPWPVIVVLYLLRTGIMNCTFPLEESVTMDFVPKAYRARWKSLESVAQFGWCGSAALGGYLADRFDYSFTFLITAAIQGSAILIWATLIPYIPRYERGRHESKGNSRADSLEKPLIGGDESALDPAFASTPGNGIARRTEAAP